MSSRITPRILVVMGVTGAGKSTVGAALAERLGGTFIEGDALHPPANVARMSAGEPLTDEDRWPWLDRIAEAAAAAPGIVIAGCSALKRAYRDRLRSGAAEPVLFIHLSGSRKLIARRMKNRKGHFMPASLLDSQFRTLEELDKDEAGFTVDIAANVDAIVRAILLAMAVPGP